MQAPYDLIILGGGCAGLSLAARLASLGPRCPKTLILEKRPEYTNDRTWCFWATDDSAWLHPLVRNQWELLEVRTPHSSTRMDCSEIPYQMVPAETFYSDALQRIRSARQITLLLDNSTIGHPLKSENLWYVETSAGMFRGAVVIDTRPSSAPFSGSSPLWQSFHGHEIECDANPFDDACLQLMDFEAANASGIQFAYVLPLKSNRALIEFTVIGHAPIPRDSLSHALDNAIAKRIQGASFRVLRSEYGVLPMGLIRQQEDGDTSYVRAGIANGAARSSTGYAFLRIQRWASQCANRIARGQPPIAHPQDPPLLRALDSLFISVLSSYPERAPEIFLALFQKTSPRRLVRFLSDRGNLLDYLTVIAALPLMPFLRAIPIAARKHISNLLDRAEQYAG